jgi:hypothetical protein
MRGLSKGPTVHHHPIWCCDVRRAEHHFDAQIAEPLRIVVHRHAAAGRSHAFHDPRERVSRRSSREPESIRVTHLMRQLGRRDERLARHTSRPEAVSTQRLPLDERYAEPEGGATGGCNQAGGATADGDEIEAVHGKRTKRSRGGVGSVRGGIDRVTRGASPRKLRRDRRTSRPPALPRAWPPHRSGT